MVLILAGAAAGAALLQVHVGAGVLLTALLSLGVAGVGATTSNNRPDAKVPSPGTAEASLSGTAAR